MAFVREEVGTRIWKAPFKDSDKGQHRKKIGLGSPKNGTFDISVAQLDRKDHGCIRKEGKEPNQGFHSFSSSTC